MTTTMMIEASSPLAAMQQPSYLARCGFGQDTAPSYASFARANFGPESFNFKDLSMIKPSHSDYFSMAPPVRGSSPTASLAADLSQNMHIDKSSPQYPTPRRALFGNGNQSFHHAATTTPPVPTSSLTPTPDGMEISPLPHKAPYGSTYSLPLPSPTPEHTPLDGVFSPALSLRSLTPFDGGDIALQLPQERRKPGALRPSLTRAKGFSTNCIPQKPNPEAQLPPFTFGSRMPRSNPPSSLALSQIFEGSSPIQEKCVNIVASPSLPAARTRPSFNLGSASRNASPLGQHVRKSSVSAVRPRKQFRRSLSMFEHPQDVMRHEIDETVVCLPSIADMEPPHVPQLPHFFSDNQTCDLPRISKETMVEVLNGKYDDMYAKRVVIDCRFEYEFDGGHIDGAVNFNDKEQLASQLFDLEPTTKALLIFHCEYSAHRAPLMAKHIRQKDRTINAERYPGLTYPEAYILDGGYSSFYKDHSNRCYPQNYVEMHAKEHANACELGLGKVKQQQRSKLVRAQTFAFGQRSPALDSSPTAMCRSRNNDDMDMDLGVEFSPAPSRPTFLQGRGQRMFSY